MEFAKEIDFTEVNKKKAAKNLPSKQKKWVDDFRISLHEVELHTQGKIKLKTAKQLLADL